MASKLIITGNDQVPIAGTVVYYDLDGIMIGQQEIAATGTVLDAALVEAAATVDITAPGFYTFSTGATAFENNDPVNVSLFPAAATPKWAVYSLIGLLLWALLKK